MSTAFLAACFTAAGLLLLAAGAVSRNAILLVIGYSLTWYGGTRGRNLMRLIDARDLPRDGRTLALAAWIGWFASAGLFPLALALVLL